MGKFIELRFGQGDLGKSISKREDVEEGQYFVQREVVPVSAIKDAFIILPDKRNIQITWKKGDRLFTRVEYYRDTIDCIKRWTMIKHALGFRAKLDGMNPVALPMDAEEMEQRKIEAEAAKYEAKAKALQAKKEEKDHE